MISDYIINNKLKVIIKPDAAKNEILEFDEGMKAVKIAIKEPAEKNRANKELIKFLGKETGKKFSIKRGSSSKEKLLILE